MKPIVGVIRPIAAPSFNTPHPAKRGIFQQAGMQGARRDEWNGGGAGDGDGVGAFGLHRRAGDGDEHGQTFNPGGPAAFAAKPSEAVLFLGRSWG